ncbi:MAG TPA: hypothetical protein RMH99_27880 [Sandaracinaceae bacterium LLY-WYZ-13_1]|nr:hypothetical protein [Sandaracinaceae bacterium LLY-WYZ-13_1]
MYEIREGTDRFHILRFEGAVGHDEANECTAKLRALVRDAVEPLMLLTDLRESEPWPDDAWSELGFAMRMNDRDVRVHVLVAAPDSEVAAEARDLVDDVASEARHVVGDMNDARRVLVDHFGAAEDYAFERYCADTRA